ncbi:1-phosphofructokinase family hexose kinase [Arthrobacter sp.]|uniref:1-phosphofructokinase family hexose kinase n=1 Tax=Arthrobacter sp. TaxID=1667 RepID=UPI003A927BB2
MITTFTANPSLDRTIELGSALVRGGVQRARTAGAQAAGKGVNVTRALVAAGVATLALLPGDDTDPVVLGLAVDGLPHRALPIGQPLRSNVTITEPDGTTTKVNEPGPSLDAAHQEQISAALLHAATESSWIVLAGSLPPGVPAYFYAETIARLHLGLGGRCPLIAVDTSDAPLACLYDAPAGLPDLIKPNAEELAGLAGTHSEAELEASPELAAAAARQLVDRGTTAVLATLGARGALLVTAEGAWLATHSPIQARSTVGAGDSSLAGYLIAHDRGATPPECLRSAVAYGAAAASLPGSLIPTPEQTSPESVTVTPLAPAPTGRLLAPSTQTPKE